MFYTFLFGFSFTYVYTDTLMYILQCTVYTQSLISIKYDTCCQDLLVCRMCTANVWWICLTYVLYILATALNHSLFSRVAYTQMAKRKLTILTEHNSNWSHRKQNSYLYNKRRASTQTNTHKFRQLYSISTCTMYKYESMHTTIECREREKITRHRLIYVCMYDDLCVCLQRFSTFRAD